MERAPAATSTRPPRRRGRRARRARCTCRCSRTRRAHPTASDAPTARPLPPTPFGPERLDERRRVHRRIAAGEVVAGGCDDEHAVRGRVVDRARLHRGRRRAAEAEVHDPRAVIDGVRDRGRLVDVGERPVARAGLEDHQLRVSAEAGDAVAVRHRAGRERGDERPVADGVADVARPGARAERNRSLGREIRRAHVGAGVDDRDRHAARGAQNPTRERRPRASPRTAIPMEPSVPDASASAGSAACLRNATRWTKEMPGCRARREAERGARRANLRHAKSRDPAHDDRAFLADGGAERGQRRVPDAVGDRRRRRAVVPGRCRRRHEECEDAASHRDADPARHPQSDRNLLTQARVKGRSAHFLKP